MISYKDKTFCSFYRDCTEGGDCWRSLTPTIIERAKKKDLYIAQFLDIPSCFSQKSYFDAKCEMAEGQLLKEKS